MSNSIFVPIVEHAIELASQWHAGTYRKSSWREAPFTILEGDDGEEAEPRVPVISHLAAVASTVQRAGWEPAVVAAAYLHDVIEDPSRHGERMSRDELAGIIGEEVAELVAQVSETKFDAQGNERPWKDRKIGYLKQLRAARSGAVAISLADKIHNLWSMNQSLERGVPIFTEGKNRTAMSGGPDRQLWFYRAVLDATRAHTDDRLPPLRSRLQSELDRFEELTA